MKHVKTEAAKGKQWPVHKGATVLRGKSQRDKGLSMYMPPFIMQLIDVNDF